MGRQCELCFLIPPPSRTAFRASIKLCCAFVSTPRLKCPIICNVIIALRTHRLYGWHGNGVLFDYDYLVPWGLLKILRNCEMAAYSFRVSTAPAFQSPRAIFLCHRDHHRVTFLTELHIEVPLVLRGIICFSIKDCLVNQEKRIPSLWDV